MSAMVARRNGHAAPVVVPAREVRRCAIYTRKSTSAGLEKDFNSLEAQREACEGYVRSQAHAGWEVLPNDYDDDGGFTGANLERPAFRQLMDDVEAGRIDVVVVYKVDRLSRSLLDFARVMDRFNRAGVAFVSVTQNFSTADAIGRLTLNMLMSFAEFEREMIAERTRDKIAASRRRGKWTGGPVPLGYDVVDGRLAVNALEAVTVRELFSLYLEHRSALVTAREMNARERKTKFVRTREGRVYGAKPWAKDPVLRILQNPIYAGYTPYGDELHEGEHDAILDRETWTQVQALLAGNAGKKKLPGRNPDYLLRGLIFCHVCKAAYTTGSTRKSSREYRYYRCVTRDKLGREGCPARPLPAEAIEDYVLGHLRTVAADASFVTDVEQRLKARVETARAALGAEREQLPPRIAELSAEGRGILDSLAGITGAGRRLVEDKVQKVGAALGQAEARLGEVERQLAGLDEAEVTAEWVASALGDFDAVFDALTPDNRARLVRALVACVDVNEPTGEVTITLADLDAPWEDAAAAKEGTP